MLFTVFRDYFLSSLYRPRPLALTSCTTTNMAEFDFGTGLKLKELSTTKAADIQGFLDLITCYHNTLSDLGKTNLISFLRAAKITGDAKVRFDEIV